MPKGFDMLQFPTRGGQSANIYNQLAGGLSAGLPDILQQLLLSAQGQPAGFEDQEKYAMDLFQQKIAPQIAQRYAGSGISGSSGMQNALAGAGGNLAQSLKAQRSDLMQQSMKDVLSLGELLLGRPDVENVFQKKKSGFWDQLLGIGAPLIGAGIGGLFGGPMGGLGGAQIGSAFGQSFLG
jgi:hypothetical protein